MTVSRRNLVTGAGLSALALPLSAPALAAGNGKGNNGRGRGNGGPRRSIAVRTGAQAQLDDGWSELAGQRVAVISNPTGVVDDLTHVVDRMHVDGVDVVAVLGPEHGVRGTAPAGASEERTTDPRTGITVYDAYGATEEDFARMYAECGAETIVFDIQDVGVRFYTYVWSMYKAMRGAAMTGGLRFVVLDRPNPVGRAVRGPLLDAAYSSGVGLRPILMQHGMTVGELARYFNTVLLPAEDGGQAIEDLTVVEVEGWSGGLWQDTGLPWVMPSPNMPTPDTALLYPGTGLFEATNLSEGRGTTRPFELIGAPYVAHRLAETLHDRGLAGVRFREAHFSPISSKNEGEVCGGVQVHLTDPASLDAPAVAVHMLTALRDLYEGFGPRDGDEYDWRWLDLLTGTSAAREQLIAGATAETLVDGWAADEVTWESARAPYLLY